MQRRRWLTALSLLALPAARAADTGSAESIKERSDAVRERLEAVRPQTLQLNAAVSLALHPEYLASLGEGARRVGAELVVRGVAGGVADEKQARLYWGRSEADRRKVRASLAEGWRKLAAAAAPAPVRVDPAFFRRFRVAGVPVFVLQTDEEKPRAVVVRGLLTWEAALEAFVSAVGDLEGKGLTHEEARLWRAFLETSLTQFKGVQGW